jgi:hypothetical protein
MSNLKSIQIDSKHSMAICREIGERLAPETQERPPLPQHLLVLMERLRELDENEVPSIAP